MANDDDAQGSNGLKYAKPGPYFTKLPPAEESAFRQWVVANKIPWQDSPKSDYDMRGYWKAMVSGDPSAKQAANKHFPDIWKTPFHKTFSNESRYALPNAPHWEGDKLVANGQDSYVALPNGSYVQVPANATPEQLSALREKLRGQQQPSFYERLTQPDVTTENPALRFLSNTGAAFMGAPGALYHAVTDAPTAQETEEFKGHTRIPGELTVERLTSAPIVRAAQDWKKMHPSVRDILSVLPEALGQGVGTVAAGEVGGKGTKFAGDTLTKGVGKLPGVQPALQEAVVGRAEVESARVAHEQKLADLEKEYEDKVREVGKKTSEDEAAYKTKVEQAKDAYAQKVAEREAKRVEASAKETGAEVKRKTFQQPRSGPVYQRLSGMADQVGEGVTKLDKSIREAYNARYNAFRHAMGDAEGNFEPVQQAVVDAEEKDLKGSPENIAIFRNILKEGEDPLLSQASVFRNPGRGVDLKEVLSSMKSEGERTRFLRGLEERDISIEERPGAKEGATLPIDQIQGYATELGNKMYGGKFPAGDIWRALKRVKEAADKEVLRVADSRGQGAIKRALDSDWAQYMGDFYDSEGALQKVKSAINSDRRIALLSGGEGSRIVDAMGRYARFNPDIGLVGRVRSLVNQLRELPSAGGKAPGEVERPRFPERPRPRTIPTRPEGRPFSSQAYRAEHIQKIAHGLQRLTHWDLLSIIYAMREIFSGSPPFALSYPIGKRLSARLLSQPGVVEYLSKEMPNVQQGRP